MGDDAMDIAQQVVNRSTTKVKPSVKVLGHETQSDKVRIAAAKLTYHAIRLLFLRH